MKKLLLLLIVVVSMSSCTSSYYYGSTYQAKNIHKFSRKKNYRTSAGPRYVRPYKRGSVMHPAVTKQSRRELKRRIIYQRYTTSN